MTMIHKITPFTRIRKKAEQRKGGVKALDTLLASAKPDKDIATTADDRLLSEMTKRVFQAGFNWDLIEQKWPAFEEAFKGFNPDRWRMMSDHDVDRLLKNKDIVRNAQKIMAVQANAALICELSKRHGSAGKAFAGWPLDDFSGLLLMLKKEGARLGGATGQWFLRGVGVDGYVFTRDVTQALIREGIVTKTPTSKRDLNAVQGAFSQWHRESGLSLMQLSKTLAFSIENDPNPNHKPL